MKRKIVTVVAGVAGLVVAFLLATGVSHLIYGNSNKSTEDQSQEAEIATESLEEAKGAMTEDEINALIADMKETEATEAEAEEIPIKFDELWEVNPDVYAWISIPGTDIEYPILQHASDNSYYLNHNIDGSYGYPGCIYTENLNSKDFTDNNTVIYGHNMKNGSMFAGLHKFESKDFFDENREVIIYLPDQVLHYTIFAAHTYDDRHLLYSFDFSDKDIYQSYLDSVFGIRDMNANIDDTMDVTSDDKIITLVTCIGSQPDKRLLVQAVLNTNGDGDIQATSDANEE